MHLSRRFGALGAAFLLALATVPMLVVPVAATDVADDAALRAAWADANESLITLTADITLTCEVQPDRVSDTEVVVDGNGFTLTQPCEGQDALHADGAGTVTLRDLVLVGNVDSDDGLDTNDGDIVVESSTVSGHGSTGLESDVSITVFGSTISNNGDDGINSDAAVLVTASTVSGNTDTGVWSGDEDDAEVIESTISGNGGNGVDAGAAAIAVRSTIVGNGFSGGFGPADARPGRTADFGTLGQVLGGGLAGEDVELTNATVVDNNSFGANAGTDIVSTYSTISGNVVNLLNAQTLETIHLFGSVVIEAGILNCSGEVAEEGHNFVDDDSCGTIPESTADPVLGTLAANGGLTQTRLPGAGSPLIDAITSAECGDVLVDQRNVSRPQGDGCDIGSVEVQAAVAPPRRRPRRWRRLELRRPRRRPARRRPAACCLTPHLPEAQRASRPCCWRSC